MFLGCSLLGKLEPLRKSAFSGRTAPEVGICLFEAESSAHMPEHELPQELKELPLRWHAHLPTDLPGLSNPALCSEASGRRAAELALGAWRRVAFLHPRFGVLHLPVPEKAGRAWKAASRGWQVFFSLARRGGESRKYRPGKRAGVRPFGFLRFGRVRRGRLVSGHGARSGLWAGRGLHAQ